MEKMKNIIPGLAIAILIGIISIGLSKFVPQIGAGALAIFIGIIVGNTLFKKPSLQAGYRFAESTLLSYSIVLLGGTFSLSTLMELGLKGVGFIILQMAITLFGVIYIGKKLGFSKDFSYLMATGNAVCGSSAIAAAAPVIGADDKDKGMTITIVNVMGIILMFLIPAITYTVYKQETLQTSAMIGGVLQSVGQVVASGAMVSEEVKDLATLFKIVRVIFLVGVLFVLTYLKQKDNHEITPTESQAVKKGKIQVPWYVIGFFITCILFSVGIITASVSHSFKFLSNQLEIIALAGIGLRVNIKDLMQQGVKATTYALIVGTLQIVCALVLIGLLF